MAEESEGVSLDGDSLPRKEMDSPSPAVVSDSVLSEIRQLPSKMALRSGSSRGRSAKLGPKSPLLRMAEMRKNGLRGKALKMSGKWISDVAEFKASRGKKARGGGGSWALATIPENGEKGTEFSGACSFEVAVGEAGVAMEDQKMDNSIMSPKASNGGVIYSAGVDLPAKEADYKKALEQGMFEDEGPPEYVLDEAMAQPLQEMDFVVNQGSLRLGMLRLD